jgi:Putative transposase
LKVHFYELKKAWRDGTRFVRLDPYELLARICAMVPQARFHMVRFHGVLAPNSVLREQVVASAKPYVPSNENTAPKLAPLPLFGNLFKQSDADVGHKRRKPWAWLLRPVFAIDVNLCPQCAGPMKWREVALSADAIRRGLMTRGGVNASIAKLPGYFSEENDGFDCPPFAKATLGFHLTAREEINARFRAHHHEGLVILELARD